MGDIEDAVSVFTKRNQEIYRSVFEVISGSLPQVVVDMVDVDLIYVHEDIAKYRIRRPKEINGETVDITCYLYFVVDTDGIWRLDQF